MSTTYTSCLERSRVAVSGVKGATQTIVFLHGLGADQSTWHLLAPAFEENYRVVRLDLVGAGQSDAAAYDYVRYGSLSAHASDLLAVLHELGLYEVVFVGHSVSAIIGVLAAIKEPARFGRLVLLAPSPRYVNAAGYAGGFEQKDITELLMAMEHNYYGWAQSMAPLMLGSVASSLTIELTNSFLRTNPSIAHHFARVTFSCDHRADLPLLTTPALIVQCAHDVLAPMSVGIYLHESLVDSQLVVVDTPGHCAHLTAPDQAQRLIEKFLQEAPLYAPSACAA